MMTLFGSDPVGISVDARIRSYAAHRKEVKERKATEKQSKESERKVVTNHDDMVLEDLIDNADDAWEAIDRMIAFQDFSVVGRLFEEITNILNCWIPNQNVALLFLRRLFTMAIILGAPKKSIMVISQNDFLRWTSLVRTSLENIEDTLSKAVRYFRRFTLPEFLSDLLFGTDLQDRLVQYDRLLTAEVNRLAMDSGLSKKAMVEGTPAYLVSQNLKVAADCIDTTEMSRAFQKPTGKSGKKQEVMMRKEYDQIKEYYQIRTDIGNKCVGSASYSIVKQRLLRKLWYDEFWGAKSRDLLSIDEYVLAAKNYLETIGDVKDSKTVCDSLERTLHKAFKIGKDGKFGPHDLARISRRVPTFERDLHVIVQMIQKYVASTVILPPMTVENKDVLWEAHEERDLIEAVRKTGYLNIYGPRQSGKSTKVLSAVYSLLDLKGKLHPRRALSKRTSAFFSQPEDSEAKEEDSQFPDISMMVNELYTSIFEIEEEEQVYDRVKRNSTIDESASKKIDALWVDFSAIQSSNECGSRLATQLFLDHRKLTALEDRLYSLRPNSVVVFDNLGNDVCVTGPSGFINFLTVISPVLQEFEGMMSFVLVTNQELSWEVTHKFCGDIRKHEIQALSDAKAREFAEQVYPLDPEMLLSACRGLPGKMARFAKYTSIGTIRQAAEAVSRETNDRGSVYYYPTDPSEFYNSPEEAIMAEGIAEELTSEESLAAGCILQGIGPFDDGLAWSLCKEAFNFDVARWHMAWKGLVASGWIHDIPDLGYVMSPVAVVTKAEDVTLEHQWETYVNYVAEQATRINAKAEETPFVLKDYYNSNISHFTALLNTFLDAVDPFQRQALTPEDAVASELYRALDKSFDEDIMAPSGDNSMDMFRRKVALTKQSLESLAQRIAGNTSFILEAFVPVSIGIKFTAGVMNAFIDRTQPTYLLAVLDCAVEYRRAQDLHQAIKILRQSTEGNEDTALNTPEFASCMSFLGVLYHENKELHEARHHLKLALSIWDGLRPRGAAGSGENAATQPAPKWEQDYNATQYRLKALGEEKAECCSIS